jgi:VIT1/CCC1 family predicted Fe2+/Mn2+ transporter
VTDKARIEEQWRDEANAAWLYKAVHGAEPQPRLKQMFLDLAAAAERQAAIFARDLGSALPVFKPDMRTRLVAGIVRLIGPKRARPLLAAMKIRGLSAYASASPPPPSVKGHAMPHAVGEFGQEHRATGGGTLRAAVFGANDGVVSNTCLILGVAGAAAEPRIVLLTGVAGLLAGAFSMAAGEYVSVRSQRELYEHQIAQERAELDRYPEEEAEELALIYAARGAPMEEARVMTRAMLSNREEALRTLAREELGLNPDDLGSPWGAAISSFIAFSLGATVPLLPFLIDRGSHSLWGSCAVSGAALFIIGAVLSLFSGRSALLGGLRMLGIGAAAGAATYFIGGLLGVGLS